MRRVRWLGVVALGMALVTPAIAQWLAEGAVGRGVARGEEGRAAEFGFEVRRVVAPGRPGRDVRLQGHFRFALAHPRERFGVELRMQDVQRLEVDRQARAAQFAGPGVLVTRGGRGVERVQGRVFVRVADNRGADAASGAEDTIAVRFDPIRSDRKLDFAGVVARGDIRVFFREGERRP
ncbi:MAG TPA: hypothetical protein VLH79_09005 [Chthonomonadales bacterium]|nr:hypothetical protein [Chthonomonadales bacterium]